MELKYICLPEYWDSYQLTSCKLLSTLPCLAIKWVFNEPSDGYYFCCCSYCDNIRGWAQDAVTDRFQSRPCHLLSGLGESQDLSGPQFPCLHNGKWYQLCKTLWGFKSRLPTRPPRMVWRGHGIPVGSGRMTFKVLLVQQGWNINSSQVLAGPEAGLTNRAWVTTLWA